MPESRNREGAVLSLNSRIAMAPHARLPAVRTIGLRPVDPTCEPRSINNDLPLNRARSRPLLDLKEMHAAEFISGDDLSVAGKGTAAGARVAVERSERQASLQVPHL
jgi:hypothetical protein